VVGSLDQSPVALLAHSPERLDEVSVLGDRVRQSLPEGRLPPSLAYAELEPLQLLARDGVLGQRGDPVLQVKGA